MKNTTDIFYASELLQYFSEFSFHQNSCAQVYILWNVGAAYDDSEQLP
jgi:hypothetical protein